MQNNIIVDLCHGTNDNLRFNFKKYENSLHNMELISMKILFDTLNIVYSGMLENRADAGFVSGYNLFEKLIKGKSDTYRPNFENLLRASYAAYLKANWYFCQICLENLNYKNDLLIASQKLEIEKTLEIQKYFSKQLKKKSLPKEWTFDENAIALFSTYDNKQTTTDDYQTNLEVYLINELETANFKLLDKYKQFHKNGCYYEGKMIKWFELYLKHLTQEISKNEALKTFLQNQLIADLPQYFADIKKGQTEFTIKYGDLITQFDSIKENNNEFLEKIE